MTSEQKLVKLLQIAIENGWTYNPNFLNASSEYKLSTEECVIYDCYCDPWLMYSINDIVLNYEEGEISFFKALGKSNLTKYWLDYTEHLRFEWTKLPTSKRLEWLFEIYKHLIYEK